LQDFGLQLQRADAVLESVILDEPAVEHPGRLDRHADARSLRGLAGLTDRQTDGGRTKWSVSDPWYGG